MTNIYCVQNFVVMTEQKRNNKLNILRKNIKGELYFDNISKTIYSTDASSYKEQPIAVAVPKNNNDIIELIKFANENNTTLIPRAAGTSLAGQVVGNGIIVDISKNFREIIEFNKEEKWVKVQPGVVLDELNMFLEEHNLFFGPETSTSNRCMIGGMLGNNSCGSHSIIYGSVRDHTIEVKTFLSDGSEVVFKEIDKGEFEEKCKLQNLEGKIYRNINKILSNKENAALIEKEYPNKKINRRNTGYAIDLLLNTNIFSNNKEKFNFSKLIAGSEGTLAFATEIKLNLVVLPPKNKVIVAIHFKSLEEALYANLIALKHKPGAVELIDETIIEITKDNLSQKNNRFFINGNPKAILLIEFTRETVDELKKFIEDTAVRVEDIPNYIADFKGILKKHSLNCVFHAHIGSGELHLRPVLNIKKQKDVDLYYQVSLETAKLVKKYNGSLSGEHGDGRLRGEFIPIMIGEHNYNLLKEVKNCWDPNNVFNKGKITDSPKMQEFLRYKPEQETRQVSTIFDFSKTLGYVRAVEKCNGSGDCRKSDVIGGTMCPSYQATKDEKNSTRARANLLREVLNDETIIKPFANKEVYEILDLCLSCKACKSECPSGVDITKLKAEFLQHYYDIYHVPFRSFLVANITSINKVLSIFPKISNFFLKNKFFSSISMKLIGFEPKRKMPLLSKTTLRKFYKKHKVSTTSKQKKVYLFADEFTNFNDADIGIKTILLLEKLNYQVIIPKHFDSGRTFLSKGLTRKAKKIAEKNINLFKNLISDETPLIGIEPSTILSFRDEYLDFFDNESENYKSAKKISENTFMIDEFLANEMKAGNISKDLFTKSAKKIKLHGHCQQKAIASTESSKYVLSFPENYEIEEIPSGCCGMAGSFGYEKEHYDLSMKIGEMVLFPAVRNANSETLIAAPGTSCRHQIKDGTNKTALHPVEILYNAMEL